MIEDSIAEQLGIDLSENEVFSSISYFKCYDIRTERMNSDRQLNNNGRRLLELCKATDLKIVNGRLGKDKNVGNFTCFNNFGKSVVDYVIVSPSLFPRISDFQIDVFCKCLSDTHSPIHVSLEFPNVIDEAQPEGDAEEDCF